MDKVVVTKSKLDSLAQHINTKAGTTGAKTIAQMQATVDGIAVGGKEEEAVTVPLNMTRGDQIVTPSEGKTLSQVTITKPDDLLPSRVVLGSNIGGVEGEYFAPEIWVLNEEIIVPAETLRFRDLAFLTCAANRGNPAETFAMQTDLLVTPRNGKVVVSALDTTAGQRVILKWDTARPSDSYADTNGWYGERRFPQIGRVIVFLQPTAALSVQSWLEQNAVLYSGNTAFNRKKGLFKLGDVDFVKVLNVTANGTYSIEPNAPYSAFEGAKVTVNVPVPSVQDTKAVTITSNGTVSVTPDAPYDALKKVDVTVDVASGGSNGFKVTFPATAANWGQIGSGAIVQADGTVISLVDYSTLAGKTIPNVLEICCWGGGYYFLRMTVQTGRIMLTYLSNMGALISTAVDGESSRTYIGNGSTARWIPLADTVISAIEMYNTD